MLTEHIGKIVTLYIDKDTKISGKLSNHKPNLYQVTGDNKHCVFWDSEINAIFTSDTKIDVIHCYYPLGLLTEKGITS